MAKPEVKSQSGRPRRRLEDIKMNFKEEELESQE